MGQHSAAGRPSRRGGRVVRLAAVVVALALLALGGGRSSTPLPSPGLQPVSVTDPVPPTGVVAGGVDRALVVSWTASTESFVSGYRVYLDGVLAASPTTTSVTVGGLVNGRPYAVTVRTATTVLGSTYVGTTAAGSPEPGTPRDSVPPAAPVGVGALRGDARVVLSWTANSADHDVDGYRVLRDGVPLTDLLAGAGTTGYTDTGLVNDRSYGYTVQTHDTSGNWSAASSPVAVATPTDLTAPAAPTGLAAARGDGQVRLSWSANAEPDVASYRVLRNGAEVATVASPGTGYTDSGLVNDSSYAYSLVAVDRHGNRSAESGPVAATPTDLTAPAPPTGLVATAGEWQVDLSWSASAEPDVASYRVLRNGAEVATVASPGTGYTDTGLVNGTSYAYSLVAVDRHGNRSVASAPVSGTPTDVAAAAPTGVTASPGDRQAELRWPTAPEPDVVGYRVLAEDGSTAATAAAPTTRATVTGLTNGTTYRFTVVAVDAGGHVSAPSAQVPVLPAPNAVPVEGAGAGGGSAVSGDGRFVVVGTRARLEAADTNTAHELYLLDRTAGTARRIAPLPASATGAGDPTNTSAPAVSDDGRYVALATTAALVAEDTNRVADVYRLDTTTGRWTPVSVPAGGKVSAVAGTVLQTGPSVYATSPSVAMSADGDVVVFYSARADLVARDGNGVVDVFAKTVSTGAVTRVSSTATGTDLPRTALGPALALTPDGRFALFPATSASGPVVLYRKTLSGAGAGTATVVSSVTSGGRTTEFGVYRDAGDVDVSDDGRHVALVTAAKLGTSTPTASWTTGLAHRVDTATGTSVSLGDGQTTAWEHQVALDPTGRYGFFGTAAAEVPGDGNGHTDLLRRDLDGGVRGPLVLVTADSAGRAGPGPTGPITPAEYGRAFPVTGDRVFVTTSQALQPTDTNGVRDLYLKDVAGGAVQAAVG